MVENNRILVIEDDTEIGELYSLMLSSDRCGVDCVETGCGALSYTDRPSCVILDWHLPDCNGADVAIGLRRRFGPQLPIILVTAHNLTKQQVDAVGARFYLRKPFDIHRLVDAVDQVLTRDRTSAIIH